MSLKPQLTYTECNVDQERTNQPWVSHVGQLDNTGRHAEAGLGRDVEPSAVGSHVDGNTYI